MRILYLGTVFIIGLAACNNAQTKTNTTCDKNFGTMGCQNACVPQECKSDNDCTTAPYTSCNTFYGGICVVPIPSGKCD